VTSASGFEIGSASSAELIADLSGFRGTRPSAAQALRPAAALLLTSSAAAQRFGSSYDRFSRRPSPDIEWYAHPPRGRGVNVSHQPFVLTRPGVDRTLLTALAEDLVSPLAPG